MDNKMTYSRVKQSSCLIFHTFFFPAQKRLLWNDTVDALKTRQVWHLVATFWKRTTSLLNLEEQQAKSDK